MAQPSAAQNEWDFGPFHYAEAVGRTSRDPRRTILNIPATKIPSPLAPHLAPVTVLELQEFLVGKPDRQGHRATPATLGGAYADNGKEVWKSWKRAWDLWNNHYIEGRVNEAWIRVEWKRQEKASREYDAKVFNRRREIEKSKSKSKPTQPGHQGRNTLPEGVNENLDDIQSYERRNWDLIEDDGTGAGWTAIKNLKDYKPPKPAHHDQDDDEDDDDNDEDEDEDVSGPKPIFDDILENSVWRPMRVGEKTFAAALDQPIEDFHDNNPFEVNGGVDCGRSPYPLLRPLIQYTEMSDGTLKKKKIWDGVGVTIFNMPTTPVEEPAEPTDPKMTLTKDMYSDTFRDRKLGPGAIFPLDIRRVSKVRPSERSKIQTPLLSKNETLISQRHVIAGTPFKNENRAKDDPWFVNPEEQRSRDTPPRRHPLPEQPYEPSLLPVDDTIWREQYDRDQFMDARYFVTNLTDSTLVINGMEVRKGTIAGPLPAFAVIECPGGQVAFWFGIGGRNHGAGRLQDEPDNRIKWKQLRAKPGWEHVKMPAGQVWEAKIADKRAAEWKGEPTDDDESWRRWKIVPEAKSSRAPKVLDHSQPPPFKTEEEELKWVALEAVRQRNPKHHNYPPLVATPEESLSWPGPNPQPDTSLYQAHCPQEEAELWAREGSHIEARQRKLVKQIAAEKAREEASVQEIFAADEARTNKRKADGTFNLQAKKAKRALLEASAKAQQEQAAAIARKEEADLTRANQPIEEKLSELRRLKLAADHARAKREKESTAAKGQKEPLLSYPAARGADVPEVDDGIDGKPATPLGVTPEHRLNISPRKGPATSSRDALKSASIEASKPTSDQPSEPLAKQGVKRPRPAVDEEGEEEAATMTGQPKPKAPRLVDGRGPSLPTRPGALPTKSSTLVHPATDHQLVETPRDIAIRERQAKWRVWYDRVWSARYAIQEGMHYSSWVKIEMRERHPEAAVVDTNFEKIRKLIKENDRRLEELRNTARSHRGANRVIWAALHDMDRRIKRTGKMLQKVRRSLDLERGEDFSEASKKVESANEAVNVDYDLILRIDSLDKTADPKKNIWQLLATLESGGETALAARLRELQLKAFQDEVHLPLWAVLRGRATAEGLIPQQWVIKHYGNMLVATWIVRHYPTEVPSEESRPVTAEQWVRMYRPGLYTAVSFERRTLDSYPQLPDPPAASGDVPGADSGPGSGSGSDSDSDSDSGPGLAPGPTPGAAPGPAPGSAPGPAPSTIKSPKPTYTAANYNDLAKLRRRIRKSLKHSLKEIGSLAGASSLDAWVRQHMGQPDASTYIEVNMAAGGPFHVSIDTLPIDPVLLPVPPRSTATTAGAGTHDARAEAIRENARRGLSWREKGQALLEVLYKVELSEWKMKLREENGLVPVDRDGGVEI